MDTQRQKRPRWEPPHCPNRKCKYHNKVDQSWPYRRMGFFRRKSDRKPVQRYLCRACGVSFSTQTFSTTYWQKRPELARQIFMRSVGCMGIRQMARDLGAAPETISRQLARMGRHCLLFHSQLSGDLLRGSRVVIDGFESFEYSQYHPFHFNLAVEPESQFFVYFNESELRRKGRMTPFQRRRREQLEAHLGRPDPKAVENGMLRLLRRILRDRPVATVLSDEHPAYPRAIRRLPNRVLHCRTNSKAARNNRNPLWPVNLLDSLIRHSQANHKRETIAFSKRRQGAIDRLMVFLVWRNYVKSQRERFPGTTPAMLRGLLGRALVVDDILHSRLFPDRVSCSAEWRQFYERRIRTRAFSVNRVHSASYVF